MGSLLSSRRFAPLFWTQLFGALADNVLKAALVVRFAGAVQDESLVAGTLLMVPFLLVSGVAGSLADGLERGSLIRLVQGGKVLVAVVAWLALTLDHAALGFAALLAIGTTSALFGPLKYAVVPQHVDGHELIAANGLLQTGTYAAILGGTLLGAAGGLLPGGVVGVGLVAIAVAARIASGWIPEAPAPGRPISWNPVGTAVEAVRTAAGNRAVWLSVLGISWFWGFGSMLLAQIPGFAAAIHGSPEVANLLLAALLLGIMGGSLLCDRIARTYVEIGLVPLGALGLTIFAVDLYFASGWRSDLAVVGWRDVLADPHGWRIIVDLVMLGAMGGLFSVPLAALVQHRSPPDQLARVIAGGNVLTGLSILGAAGLAMVGLSAGLAVPDLYLVAGLANLAVALYLFTVWPEFVVRFLVWLLMLVVYRLKITGGLNLPRSGPALLVCNHITYVDSLVLSAASPRPLRFVMYHTYWKMPVMNFIFRTVRAIPIAPKKEDEAMLERAMDEIAKALAEGDVVCLFPEGRLTETGEMNEFKPGVERVLERSPVPVIPMALRGLWGSFFSREGGRAMSRPFRRVRSAIELEIAAPMAPEGVTAAQLQDLIGRMRGDRA